jgi:TRAP-type uncharacterized transport system substrate-binding protein
MTLDNLALLSRREIVRWAVVVIALVAAALWVSFRLLQPMPPRKIVLASGAEFGLYHQYALRYREILARDGIEVEVRRSAGAGENLRLLLESPAVVDVAFLQGGVATFPEADGLVMLASLYYEPLWIFYRDAGTLSKIREFKGKRIATGGPGSGTHSYSLPLLAANGVVPGTATLVPVVGPDALAALQRGDVDAIFYLGGARTPFIQQALRDPALKLMSLPRAEAYQRRFAHISRLTLPEGTVDLALDLPNQSVTLIGTEAMLVARDGLHPALVNLLADAAREIHSGQGVFEAAGEFPNTEPVDLRVSPHATNHRRFGASALYRWLPFWVAAFVERAIILVVPLLVVLVPMANYLPQFLRWRVRSRIYRWYGELALLERDVGTRQDPPPIDRWMRDLDRIERAVGGVRTPASFASEAYTLREHIDLVRRAVLARAAAGAARPAAPGSAASAESVPSAVTAVPRESR